MADSEKQKRKVVIEDMERGVVLARAKLEQSTQRKLRELLGERLVDALSSRSATERYAVNPDARAREGAFHLIAFHWQPTHSEKELYWTTLKNDPDAQVRQGAIVCLAKLYHGTRNQGLCFEFAKIARDESLPSPLRRGAYLGLFAVQGAPPSSSRLLAAFRLQPDEFLKQVDWEMVDSFLPK